MDIFLESSDGIGSCSVWTTGLQILPAVLLIVLSPIEIRSQGSKIRKGHPLNFVILFRLLIVLISLFKTAHDLRIDMNSSKRSLLRLAVGIADMLSYVWLFVLLLTSKSKGSVRSAAVWFFVLAVNVVTVIRLFLSVDLQDDETWIRELAVPILLLILCSVADNSTHSGTKGAEVDVRDKISFPSFLTMNWCAKLVSEGWKQRLETSDLHSLAAGGDAATVGLVLKRSVLLSNADNSSGPQVDLTSALFHAFWFEILRDALCRIVSELGGVINPLLLRELLQFATGGSDRHNDNSYGYLIAFLMAICSLAVNLSQHWHFLFAQKTGIRMRSAIMTLIYDKTVTMCNSVRKDRKVGEIVNLMSVDADRLRALMDHAHFLWSGPLTFAISGFLLYQELGWSAFVGMGLLVISGPINGMISRSMKTHEKERLKAKDERINKTSEILFNMKIVKFFAWEKAFTAVIEKIRDRELSAILRIGYSNTAPAVMVSLIPLVVMAATFSSYLLSDESNILTPAKVMFSMSLLNYMRLPLAVLPFVLSSLVNARVAVSRISSFLSLPDRKEYVKREEDQESHVTMEEAVLNWHEESDSRFSLQVESLKVSRGSLVAVVGSVGSGKSSLIAALLGDMRLISGKVAIAADVGTMAYVPQQAWILNQTVRENILFGRKLHEDKYQQVLTACALQEDIELWTDGDETQIGEKGINVSGGQKQRISIARAVYSDADVFLFDDPLSAVDAHVAKHLFDNVFSSQTGILRNKTRILVTNNLTVLSGVDQVVTLKQGKTTVVSDVEELFSDPDLTNIQSGSEFVEKEEQDDQSKAKELKKAAVTLMQEEKRSAGSVKFSVFWSYLKYQPLFPVVVIMIIVSQAFDAGTSLWLTFWSRIPVQQQMEEKEERIEILSSFVVLASAGILISSLILAHECVTASRHMHQLLLSSVMRSPMSFFETTPIGRILNRFVNDMDSVDSSMQRAMQMFMTQIAQMIAVVAIVVYIIPLYTLAVIPFTIIVILTYKYGLASERQVRRLDSTTQSRIYSHFSETIVGISSIRAYGVSDSFTQSFAEKVDDCQKCSHTFTELVRWRCMRLDLIGNITVITAAVFAVLTRGQADPAFIGLAIVYAMRLPAVLNLVIAGMAGVESEGVSVERVLEYTALESEAEWQTPPEKQPPDNWPSDGGIEWQEYSARYRPGLDLVLKDLNIKIKAREKIGIVGRTGAGKSTISLSLFRIMEAAKGRILMDGVDIAAIGLHDLRSKLTMIPQDAILFSGTIRSNLDPFSERTDDELWSCLESAHLSAYVRSQAAGLEHPVSESGENMSAGERQLLCLARALARRTCILLMDEATAAVDTETDDLIQCTIRREFSHCTVLTIAHRLHTILDSDRVLVLSDGRIAEFDEPQVLLNDSTSRFHALALDAGIPISAPTDRTADREPESDTQETDL